MNRDRRRPGVGRPEPERSQGLFGALKWSYIGSFVNGGFHLALVMVLARLLEPEDFGAYGILLAVIGLATLICVWGLDSAIIQRPDLEVRHIALVTVIAGASGLLGSLVIMAAAPLIARHFDAPEVAPVLLYGAPILAVAVLANIGIALVRRAMDFRWLTLMNLASFFLGFAPTALGLALLGAGVWAMVCAFAAQTLVRALAIAIRLRGARWHWPMSPTKAVGLLAYGIKTALYHWLNALEDTIINFMILDLYGLHQLGIFNRMDRLRRIPQDYLGMAPLAAIFAHFSRTFRESGNLAREFKGSFSVMATFVAPIFFGAAVAPDPIVAVILGDKYIDDARLAAWLFIAAPFIVCHAVASNLVVATGRLLPPIAVQAAFLVTFLIAVLVLPGRSLETFVMTWAILLIVRYLFYLWTAKNATGLSLGALAALHCLPAWQTVFACGAIWGAAALFADQPPVLLLLLLIAAGALGVSCGLLLAPASLFEEVLLRAFHSKAQGRYRLLDRLLLLKFGSREPWATPERPDRGPHGRGKQ